MSDVQNSFIAGYEKNLDLLARTKARQVFLLKCRRLKLTPRFISDRTSRVLLAYENETEETRKSVHRHVETLNHSLLNIEIGICCHKIEDINAAISHSKSLIESNVTVEQSTIFTRCQLTFEQTLRSQNNHKFEKLSALIQQQGILNDIQFDPSCIKNMTNIEIPKDVMVLLSLGPKFAVRPSEIPINDLITDVECINSRITDANVKRIARGQTAYLLAKNSHGQAKHDRITRFLDSATKHTAHFLRQNPDIIISNSDKGSVTMITDLNDYRSKMETLLQHTRLPPLGSTHNINSTNQVYPFDQ